MKIMIVCIGNTMLPSLMNLNEEIGNGKSGNQLGTIYYQRKIDMKYFGPLIFINVF